MDPKCAAQGEKPTLLIDAMFGTGLTRTIPLVCGQSFQAVKERAVTRAAHPWHVRFFVVAVDVPSGLDADSGETLLPRFAARFAGGSDDIEAYTDYHNTEFAPRMLHCDLCVTFHAPKIAHYSTEIGQKRPFVVDIGLPDCTAVFDPMFLLGAPRDNGHVRLISPVPETKPRHIKNWIKGTTQMGRWITSHKYGRGHALVLGGGAGKTGAARLAVRAALRCGAGLATLGVPHEAVAECAAQLTSIMLAEIGDAKALAKILEDARISALCLGPGLGIGARTQALVTTALAASDISDGHDRRRFVLDADALTSFADAPDELFDMLHEACVLTPHEGEFARIFPDLAEKQRRQNTSSPQMSKVDAVREASKRAGCTVLLKGPATVIASPDGTASIHAALYDRTAPWLATAGAGDVLAGIITGLLANDMASFYIHQIVEVATYLHVESARSFGPGLIAEDLPEELPKVFSALGL